MQQRLPQTLARRIHIVAMLVLVALAAAFSSGASRAFALQNPHEAASTQSAQCSVCHSPHRTGDLVRDSASTQSVCLSCHTVGSKAADPSTGHDIQVGGTMSCTNCHSPHQTGPDSRYVNPDDRTQRLTSPLKQIVDAQGAVYVLVGSAHDALAPAISGIALDSSADGTAPFVTWTTSELATSWVDWGTSTQYEFGNETSGTPYGSAGLVTAHRVSMQGLVPGTTYHYRVRSADALGNSSVSADRTFTAYVTPPLESAVMAPLSSAAATLTYSDEFNGPLDTSVWQVRTPFNTQFVPGQLQWYDPANISFLNGNLRILTERRAVNGYDYASGMISSLSRSQFTYGYFESRAKLPTGKGMWPAVWLTNDRTQEIDIMELLGERPTRMYMTYHQAGTQVYQQYFEGPDFSQGYHTFGMDWQPTYIRWYVDGVLRAEFTGDIPSDPMWLVFNTAVGGDWPQPPDSSTPLPQSYDIDYVRVYDHKPADVAAPGAASTDATGGVSASGYSVDTDSISLTLDGIARRTLSAVAGWESAGAESAKPTPADPGTPVDAAAVSRTIANDGQHLTTHLAATDRQWNWQLLKFDAGASDLNSLRSLNVLWNGHGEPTEGYPTALYLWEGGQWKALASRQMGTDTAVFGERSSVSAEFCLTCHDEAAPAGVTPPTGLTNIRATWSADLHGEGLGTGFGAAQLKAPYARGSAAVQCTTCHDTHGTSNIDHLPTTINGQAGISATNGSELRSACSACHQGTLSDWHSPCVECHRTGHWAGWVDPPVESLLPTEASDCTQCHGHGKSWTHPATCIRCHGLTELRALGATPDAPWTYGHTF